MFSKAVPLVLPAVLAGGFALCAGVASSPSLAKDNCKRLPSASLIILIPEGGCDVTDPDKQPKVADDVTVIRGSAPIVRLGKNTSARITRQVEPGGPVIVIINTDL